MMADELRRARAAVRERIERTAGRRAAATGGTGSSRPMRVGIGEVDTLALETMGEITESGGTTVNSMAIETGGEVT